MQAQLGQAAAPRLGPAIGAVTAPRVKIGLTFNFVYADGMQVCEVVQLIKN
jgi:hypothetical protein